ncbi:translocator protein-like [Diorhabda sublineata]|uniref:translocator protein-like n=1 Tax=Diorhabda sublineata TaxID=1163346 RepID=UPI0024E05F2D|nr:translocator protein-like [Diorhabda sublineata]
MIQLNWPALGFTILPNIGGIAGGFFTKSSIKPWLENLKRPNWRPPNWVFGPVWTTLYSGMGYASYLVYRDGEGFNGAAKLPLIVYGTNLAANWAWAPIFFGKKDLQLALIEMQLINGTAIGMAYLFYKINPTAGYLIVPYCLWMGIATALNYCLWRDNKPTPELKGN